MVYEHVFAPTGSVGFKQVSGHCIPYSQVFTHHNRHLLDPICLSLLLTSRKTYEEAEHIFYEKNEFTALIGEEDWILEFKKMPRRVRRIVVEFAPVLLEPSFRPIWHDVESVMLLRRAWHAIGAIDSLARAGRELKSVTVNLPARFDVELFIYDYREKLLASEIEPDTSFVDYFVQFQDRMVMDYMFPFFCGLGESVSPTALFPHARANRDCEYRVVCNHALWDDEQVEDGIAKGCSPGSSNPLASLFPRKYFSQSSNMRKFALHIGDEFPKAVFAVVHAFFGGELWHNGKLIWKEGRLQDSAFAKNTPFDNAILKLVRIEALGEGQEFPWYEETVNLEGLT